MRQLSIDMQNLASYTPLPVKNSYEIKRAGNWKTKDQADPL